MATGGKLCDYAQLINQVNDDYFNLNDRDFDSDDDTSDWASACAAIDAIEQDSDCESVKNDEQPLENLNNFSKSKTQNETERENVIQQAAASTSQAISSASTSQAIPSAPTSKAKKRKYHVTDSNTIPDVVSNFKCSCKAGNCLSKFSAENINLQLIYYTSLSKSELDLVLLAKVSTFLNTSASVGKSSKHKEKQREWTRCEFTHEGK